MNFNVKSCPLPKKFFSEIPTLAKAPSVLEKPPPTENCPVCFSLTLKTISVLSFFFVCTFSEFTVSKKPKFLILCSDLFNFELLKLSPSLNFISLLITLSLVLVFPLTCILFTYIFLDLLIIIVTSISLVSFFLFKFGRTSKKAKPKLPPYSLISFITISNLLILYFFPSNIFDNFSISLLSISL